MPAVQPAPEPGSASAVQAVEIVRRFDTVTALDRASLAIPRGEFYSLLGPSGCGKTTFLRIVAGLEYPDSGHLYLGGSDVRDIPAHRRPVNTVFQSYALFPHLSVHDNVAFGLRMKATPRAEITARVKRAMEMVQIAELSARKPHQISGGQRQRVALARAVINEPSVLLLDEPLAALDVKLRRELQRELHALQRRLGITFLLVTHDQDEALSLSDRMAIMSSGRVVQTGAPSEIYEHPANAFVAQFVGGCNLIDAAGSGDRVETPLGVLRMHATAPSARFTLAVRPERIMPGVGTENNFHAVVSAVTYSGAETHLEVRCQSQALKVMIVNAAGAFRISAGESIAFNIPPDALLALKSP